MDHRQKLKELLARKSVFKGHFKLTSGRESGYYIDCKLTTLDAEGAFRTAQAILALLEREGIEADAIGGLTIGADPIVAAIAAISYSKGKPLPGFLIRKEAKAHGQRKQLEGIDPKSLKRVIIVDEVCTTGQSTEEAINVAEAEGLEVAGVVSLVDREEGGSEKFRKKYRYFSVFTAKELLEADAGADQGPDQTAHPTGKSAAGEPKSA